MRGADGALPEAIGCQIQPLMSKDLAAARDLAVELGVDTPLADVARTHVRETLGLPPEAPSSPARERGLAMMDTVYGPGFGQNLPEDSSPFTDTTVEHLFADVWARPGLDIRDRRLLVLGATAALGRPDLVQIQVRGALANHELTPEQLRETALQLAYYVGWGNATATHQGIEAALADTLQENK
jgi:alkylhydroperoxidase/carboxymuconolactone decarboxylase family protein YurZ